MSAHLTHIVRHPLKAIGRENLSETYLTAGRWLPGDRVWAVTHTKSQIEGNGWAQKMNFLRGVSGPSLMAVTANFDESTGTLSLSHPEVEDITIKPDDPDHRAPLCAWLTQIWPEDLPSPTGVYTTSQAHLTDVPDPWVSIHNHASHRAVEQRIGRELSIQRWRGNLWIDGLAPWQEFEWVGHEIRIGETVLAVREPITRCKATMANPDTGRRDADTLAALRTWGHQDFGVYAEVIEGGPIRVGDQVTVPV